MAHTVRFLGTRFNVMSPEEAMALLLPRILIRQAGKINFANAHTMVSAAQNVQLVQALQNSDMVLADGSGVRMGSALLGDPLVYNLNGTDLVPALCKAGAEKGLSVYLLGGKPGVAAEAAANLKKAYPGLVIAGTHHGYFRQEETSRILENVREANPHLLLVAFGVPLQELWIEKHASELPGVTLMGVGGLFDFLAVRVKRAPKVIRTLGMEWCWRLAMEPRRLWKRYLLGNFVFFSLVFASSFAPQTAGEWDGIRSTHNFDFYDFETANGSFSPELNEPQVA